MKISPFTPLFFNPSTSSCGLGSRYMQTFAPTDKILIEVIGSVGDTAPVATVNDLCSETVYDTITWQNWQMNDSDLLFFRVLNGMADGMYSVTIGGVESEPFAISSDERDLAGTTLLQYSMRDNKQRNDAVFFINYVQYFFDFRIHGGFKDSGWGYGVDNEQFSTQGGYIVELYSHETLKKALTVGNNVGSPIWFGEHLNRILTCNYVYLNGQRYVRDAQSVPEATAIGDLNNSFVFSQQLIKVETPDPVLENTNQTLLRRVDSTYYREAETGTSTNPLTI